METTQDLYLVIGDNTEYCAWASQRLYPDSKLLTSIDLPVKAGYYYTSLADVTADELLPLCSVAKVINYRPPLKWNSAGLQSHTEDFLNDLVIKHRLKIQNFSVITDPTHSLLLADSRKTDQPQLWIVGCSFAHGFGLNPDQRYASILSNKFNQSFSDLTGPGTSIEWATDQILRSDIRKNDIVIWGITGINRATYYINDRPVSIVAGIIDHLSIGKEEKKFFNKLCTDDNKLNFSIKYIHQVHNFVNKVGAKLICFNHDLSLSDHNKIFERYLYALEEFLPISPLVDYAPDGSHPGIITNQNWADEIEQHLKEQL